MNPPQRHLSGRNPHHDYTDAGAYFVTAVAFHRATIFDSSTARGVAERAWLSLPKHHPGSDVDAFVVMPNHIHGIVWIENAEVRPALSAVVAGFKAQVTRELRRCDPAVRDVWQPGFYEHVIRTVESLARIRRYIVDNPARWVADPENPEGQPDARESEFTALLQEERMERGGLRPRT